MDIYVGNISYQSTEEEMKESFEAFGQVDAVRFIRDYDTKRFKGFAFVTMANQEEAEAAINGLNGQEVNGRPLKISAARRGADNKDADKTTSHF